MELLLFQSETQVFHSCSISGNILDSIVQKLLGNIDGGCKVAPCLQPRGVHPHHVSLQVDLGIAADD